ncbi:MAG TPA: hypothetical protein DEB24_06210 [Coriobacteriia bacterium]|nr:hypothetical protein [Coriobacteriia bacterium]
MSEKAWTGNKGEWGEAYVLLRLLGEGTVHNADDELYRIDTQYSRIAAIMRQESNGDLLRFSVYSKIPHGSSDALIAVERNRELIATIPALRFKEAADALYETIKGESKATFPSDVQVFLESIGCCQLKAGSSHKADLAARVLDHFTGSIIDKHYSIKSLIGSEPTLANVSRLTFFEYELRGLDEAGYRELESMPMSGGPWLKDKVARAEQLCDAIVFAGVSGEVFGKNLKTCHYRCPQVMAYALLYSYSVKGKRSPDVLHLLQEQDPAGFGPDDLEDYEIAYRKYLWAVLFGMMPSKRWTDNESVDGYLIAKDDGDVLSYQISQRRKFENYLLCHSALDTPARRSSTDGSAMQALGTVIERSGKYYLRLNLQVRFKQEKYKGDHPVSEEADYFLLSTT